VALAAALRGLPENRKFLGVALLERRRTLRKQRLTEAAAEGIEEGCGSFKTTAGASESVA